MSRPRNARPENAAEREERIRVEREITRECLRPPEGEAIRKFMAALQEGMEARGPEELWNLLGCDVDGMYLDDEAKKFRDEAAALIEAVNKLGWKFDVPPEIDEEDE